MADPIIPTKVPSFLDIPKREQQRLSKEEMNLMIALMMRKEKPATEPFTVEGALSIIGPTGDFPVQLLHKRLHAHGLDGAITNAMAVWLIYLANGNPAKLVMWAYTVHRMRQQNGGRMIDFELNGFVQFFPDGLPNDQHYTYYWEAQKDHADRRSLGDNRLDRSETWD